ncbi:MAG: HD domain-containing protein [Candidatus Bathyarchaeia archaeon]
MNITKLVDFLIQSNDLKKLYRSGWLAAGLKNPESVADHSYQTALIAMILSDLTGQDTGRVVKLALLHDLAEAIIGDATPSQKERYEDYETEEREAMKETLSRLPEELAREYILLWVEYEEGSTPEAEIVHDADKLDMIIQAFTYEKTLGGIEPLETFWDIKPKSDISKKMFKLLKSKRDEHDKP